MLLLLLSRNILELGAVVLSWVHLNIFWLSTRRLSCVCFNYYPLSCSFAPSRLYGMFHLPARRISSRNVFLLLAVSFATSQHNSPLFFESPLYIFFFCFQLTHTKGRRTARYRCSRVFVRSSCRMKIWLKSSASTFA